MILWFSKRNRVYFMSCVQSCQKSLRHQHCYNLKTTLYCEPEYPRDLIYYKISLESASLELCKGFSSRLENTHVSKLVNILLNRCLVLSNNVSMLVQRIFKHIVELKVGRKYGILLLNGDQFAWKFAKSNINVDPILKWPYFIFFLKSVFKGRIIVL